MYAKKWLKVFFLTLILGLLPYLFTYFFLKANFENNRYSEIVERQLKNNSVYGTALNQNTFSYKLELIKKVKPEIISLGSSRVMQFRKESFKTTFVNAGGAMNYLNEGYEFLKKMYKYHNPKYILLGVDFFWFNDHFNQPSFFPYHQNRGTTIDYAKISKTFSWLISGKIKPDTLRHLYDNAKLKNEYTDYDNLGFSAITTSDGFRSDGSYFYSKIIFGIENSKDSGFKDTFSRIEKGHKRFEYGSQISKNRIKTLDKIINLIEKNNTNLILVVPPVANAVNIKMGSSGKYDYVDDFRKLIKEQNYESYDYHNLSVLTKNDCECIDGFHGGDIIYKRLLLDMHNRESGISQYLNKDQIINDINQFEGKVLTKLQGEHFMNKEIDFLKLDCNK